LAVISRQLAVKTKASIKYHHSGMFRFCHAGIISAGTDSNHEHLTWIPACIYYGHAGMMTAGAHFVFAFYCKLPTNDCQLLY
jgi:hypothetical protein